MKYLLGLVLLGWPFAALIGYSICTGEDLAELCYMGLLLGVGLSIIIGAILLSSSK